MQAKKRRQTPSAQPPSGERIQVPGEYWEKLQQKSIAQVCQDSLATPHAPEGLRMRFLNDDVLVDIQNGLIYRGADDTWKKIDYPLMELVILVYLINVTPAPLAQEMISVKDLRDAQFFQGPHVLKTAPVLERYGSNLSGFKRAAENLGGERLELADAAYRFSPLPKTPLFYLLWEGDEEFRPHLSILFDRSIELHLSADAIWGLVILVSNALLIGA